VTRVRRSLSGAAVARLSAAGKAGRVLAPILDLVRVGGLPAVSALRDAAGTGEWGAAVRRHVYERIWTDAADRLGATISPLGDDFLAIRRGSASTVVSYQQVQLDNAVDLELALHRGIVHRRLVELGIPVAPYREFAYGDLGPAHEFLARTGRCVVKPAAGTSGGEGVTCGIETPAELERAVLCARRWDPQRAVIEEHVRGDEYRLLFLDGRLLGVVRRRAPEVVGDGRASVLELLARENARRAASDGRLGMSPVNVELDCVLALARAGLRLGSTVPPGRRVAVKSMVNQSGAADTVTVPRCLVGDELVRDAANAARAAGVRLAAVEVITPDLSLPLADAAGIVLEVNGTPGLHYHYLVADPERLVPVAVPIAEQLLTEAERG
jgi:cyanophycin synthetase